MRLQPNVKILRGPIDAAPLVGVLFLLLIFVLLSSQYVFIPGVNVKIQLPEDGTLELIGVAGPKIAVVLDQSGTIFFQNQITSERSLAVKLAQAVKESKQDLTLVVFADRSAQHGEVVKVMQLARSVGIPNAVEAMRPGIGFQPVAPARTNK